MLRLLRMRDICLACVLPDPKPDNWSSRAACGSGTCHADICNCHQLKVRRWQQDKRCKATCTRTSWRGCSNDQGSFRISNDLKQFFAWLNAGTCTTSGLGEKRCACCNRRLCMVGRPILWTDSLCQVTAADYPVSSCSSSKVLMTDYLAIRWGVSTYLRNQEID